MSNGPDPAQIMVGPVGFHLSGGESPLDTDQQLNEPCKGHDENGQGAIGNRDRAILSHKKTEKGKNIALTILHVATKIKGIIIYISQCTRANT